MKNIENFNMAFNDLIPYTYVEKNIEDSESVSHQDLNLPAKKEKTKKATKKAVVVILDIESGNELEECSD